MDLYLSVILYYIVFIICLILFAKADASQNDKRIRFYIIAGVILLSFFACLRAGDVGWDTADTVNARFERVKNYNSIASLMANRDRIKEPIYWLISYFIMKFTSSSRVFLFIVQLLTAGPIAKVAYDKRKEIPVSIIMFAYMMLLYQMSFNIIRESVAAALLLLAYTRFMRKSFVSAAIYAVLCCLFHNSGIIGVAMIILLYFMTSNHSIYLRIGVIVTYVIAGFLALTYRHLIFAWLQETELVGSAYNDYLQIFSGNVESRFTTFRYRNIVIEALRIIGTLFILFTLKGEHTGSEQDVRLIKYASVLSLAIYTVFVTVFNSTLGHRITIYLDYLTILLYAYYFPKSLFTEKKIAHGRIVIPKTGIRFSLLYCVLFNVAVYMIINFGHTLPYHLS